MQWQMGSFCLLSSHSTMSTFPPHTKLGFLVASLSPLRARVAVLALPHDASDAAAFVTLGAEAQMQLVGAG